MSFKLRLSLSIFTALMLGCHPENTNKTQFFKSKVIEIPKSHAGCEWQHQKLLIFDNEKIEFNFLQCPRYKDIPKYGWKRTFAVKQNSEVTLWLTPTDPNFPTKPGTIMKFWKHSGTPEEFLQPRLNSQVNGCTFGFDEDQNWRFGFRKSEWLTTGSKGYDGPFPYDPHNQCDTSVETNFGSRYIYVFKDGYVLRIDEYLLATTMDIRPLEPSSITLFSSNKSPS